MTPQKSFDDFDRGCSRGECRWLRRDHATGMVVEEGLVILGTCDLLGGTAYDRRCEALVRRVVLDAQELQVALGPFMCEDTKRDLAQLKSAASRISARMDRAQIDNVKAAMTRPIPQEGRR